MKLLFIADLHYSLKQFDWVATHSANYDLVILGGDLLDLAGALDIELQIVVIEKYLQRISPKTRLVVSSGNHDGDGRETSGESVARWIVDAKAAQLFVDGDSVEVEDSLITVCPWWDGPESRARIEVHLARD